MKYILIIFAFLFNSSYADPFYKEDSLKKDPVISEFAKNSEKPTACIPEENLEKLMLDNPFEQLKFIGVIQKEKVAKALFLDAEQQVIDLKQDLLIIPAMIEIKQVDLKGMKYIDWANSTDCLNPILVTKRL